MNPFSDEATDAVPGLRRAARAAAGGAPVLLGGEVPEAYDTPGGAAARHPAHRPDRPAAHPAHPRRAAARRGHAALRHRDRDPVLRVRARRELARSSRTSWASRRSTRASSSSRSSSWWRSGSTTTSSCSRASGRSAPQHETTKAAVIAALERTGGVITSAGLVLAATFSVLMALPLESLFQVGFVVALRPARGHLPRAGASGAFDRGSARRAQLVAQRASPLV